MNFTIIYKLLSIIIFVLAAAFTFCLGISIFMESGAMKHEWIACIVISIIVASVFYILGHRGQAHMYRKEAMATISFSWIISSLIGALPYIIILKCSPVDALFESSAGFTTTGASVFNTIDSFPMSLMFWRCMSQWIGGLGMVVFFVCVLSMIGGSGKLLYSHEASAKISDMNASNIQSNALSIIALYLTLSAICSILYHYAGMSWFDAICHTFTTLSTGGFSTHGESIAYFNSPVIEWICIVFMMIGGTSFFFILSAIKGKRRSKLKDQSELLAYYGIFAGMTLLISITLFSYGNYSHGLEKTIRDSAFQVASLLTSTGFASTDFEAWIPVEHILLPLVMIIGGCTGSTAGGIKVLRIVIAFKTCLNHVEKVFRPNIIRTININNKALNDTERDGAINYLLLVITLCFLSFALLAIMEPMMSPEGIISCVIASIFNVGPGFAEIGATDNYGFLQNHSKIFLSLLMIMGRLEFYAIVTMLVPAFWRKI